MVIRTGLRKQLLAWILAVSLCMTGIPFAAAPIQVQAAETKAQLSDMWAAGTGNTWLFCGGTEGVADFSKDGTTRNWVGLFEDMLRFYGSHVERGRFVFNTSKRGADVGYIADHYAAMIEQYGTKAVGIMVGREDYQKDYAGESAFKTDLNVLIEQIEEEGKIPFLITPYPSRNEDDNDLIEIYKDAMFEVAGDTVPVVDLTSISKELVRGDGSLTPAGHQAVANQIKNSLSVRDTNNNIPVTNYAFNQLSDGVYTVAKKAADGTEAQVKSVTEFDGGITVSVDPDSLSTPKAVLAYTLEDAMGQMISGNAPEGQTTFTIDGLKLNERYWLTVYDKGRGSVTESYQRILVTAAKDAKHILADPEPTIVGGIWQKFDSGDPMTYLFMGDSITHGIVTQGYDNVPQMFAKYLDELGRTDDVVLNTGVSNATIATTLDQIEPRLMRYLPDVVFVMLGTNDVSYNGENTVTNGVPSRNGITVEQFKDRYKELVRKIHENDADTSIVLRVPCEMIVDGAHSGYEEKFEAIYDVALEMRDEIPGLDITVVDHRKEWLNYRDNVRNDNISQTAQYGWLVDIVHPNGRGNLSMFQQIIKEIGIYDSTSELANYQYALNDWTDTSEIAAPVTQCGTRAQFPMNALAGYANGLKNVTVTLTEGNREISKTAEYDAAKVLALDGLSPDKPYTVSVTGKDAINSKEISFAAKLLQSSDQTATDAQRSELTELLAAAKKTDTSAYPSEVIAAFQSALKAVEDTYAMKPDLTVTELDTAITAVKKAVLDAERAFAQAKRSAADAIRTALVKADAKYQAGQQNYTQASWDAYVKAYQAAKAANLNTSSIEALKYLLSELNAAEAKLEHTPSVQPPADTVPAPDTKLEQGKTYTAGNYSYKITDISKMTAEVAGAKKNIAKIVVANQVAIHGQTVKVTSIAASAFKNNKKAVSAVIGTNVEAIGKNAFAGCSKIGSVTVKSKKLKKIGANAFSNCKSLKKITFKTKALKTVGKNAFKGTGAKLVIKVPKAQLKQYKKLLSGKGQGKNAKITK